MLDNVTLVDLGMHYKVAVRTRDKLRAEGSEHLANRYAGRIADLVSEFEHRRIPVPTLTDD